MSAPKRTVRVTGTVKIPERALRMSGLLRSLRLLFRVLEVEEAEILD